MRHDFVDPAIADVWLVTKVVRMARGFGLGLTLYTYTAFLYEKFISAGNSSQNALKITVLIAIIGEVCTLLSEIPTGAIADHLGRKKSTILSFVLVFFACSIKSVLPFANSTEDIIILSILEVVIYSFSFTFFSGCFVAWIVDAVHERNIAEGHAPILARSFVYLFYSQIVGAVFGLSLYLSGYIFYAFALGSTVSLLCAVFCKIWMKENTSLTFHQGPLTLKASAKKVFEIISRGFKISTKTPAIIYLVLIYAGFKFLSDLVNSLWPISMRANFGVGKMSPYWFVIVFSQLTMALFGSKLLSRLIRSKNKMTNVSLWLWYAIISFLIGLVVIALGINTMKHSTPLYFFMFTIAFCQFGYGFLTPAYNTLINAYIPKEYAQQRATILSMGSMIISFFGIVLLFPSSGPSGESTTIGWILPGALLVILTLIVHVLLRRYQRKIGEIPTVTVRDQLGTVQGE